MNTSKIKISFLALLCCLGFTAQAQLANITYVTQVNNVNSHENSPSGSCWEVGTESYTAHMWSWDNIDGTLQGGSCMTCDNNGDCNFGGGTAIRRKNKSNSNYCFQNSGMGK